MEPEYRPEATAVFMPSLEGFRPSGRVSEYRAVFHVPLPFWIAFRDPTTVGVTKDAYEFAITFDNTVVLLLQMTHYEQGPPSWCFVERPRSEVGKSPPKAVLPHAPGREPRTVEIRHIEHNTLVTAVANARWASPEPTQEFVNSRWPLVLDVVNLAIDCYREALPPSVLEHAPPAYSLAWHGPAGVSIEALCKHAEGESWCRLCAGILTSIGGSAQTPPFEAWGLPTVPSSCEANQLPGDIGLGLLGEAFAALSGRDTRSSVVKCYSALEIAARRCIAERLHRSLRPCMPDEKKQEEFVHRYLARVRNEDLLSTELDLHFGRNLRTQRRGLWRKIRDLNTLRNDVVHEGKTPSYENAMTACYATRDALVWLREVAGRGGPFLSVGTGSHDLEISAWGWNLTLSRPRNRGYRGP